MTLPEQGRKYPDENSTGSFNNFEQQMELALSNRSKDLDELSQCIYPNTSLVPIKSKKGYTLLVLANPKIEWDITSRVSGVEYLIVTPTGHLAKLAFANFEFEDINYRKDSQCLSGMDKLSGRSPLALFSQMLFKARRGSGGGQTQDEVTATWDFYDQNKDGNLPIIEISSGREKAIYGGRSEHRSIKLVQRPKDLAKAREEFISLFKQQQETVRKIDPGNLVKVEVIHQAFLNNYFPLFESEKQKNRRGINGLLSNLLMAVLSRLERDE